MRNIKRDKNYPKELERLKKTVSKDGIESLANEDCIK